MPNNDMTPDEGNPSVTDFEATLETTITDWIAQGRDPEHIHAIRNFFSGTGRRILEAHNREVREARRDELEHISHASGGGSWRRVIEMRLAGLNNQEGDKNES